MEASRDDWLDKTIERQERIVALEAALARATTVTQGIEDIAGSALVVCVLGSGKCESGCCAAIEKIHNRVELLRDTPDTRAGTEGHE
jgi:hypothetical protein